MLVTSEPEMVDCSQTQTLSQKPSVKKNHKRQLSNSTQQTAGLLQTQQQTISKMKTENEILHQEHFKQQNKL